MFEVHETDCRMHKSCPLNDGQAVTWYWIYIANRISGR